MAGSGGSIYAEAELNIDKFISAAGALDGAAVGIAVAMEMCAVRIERAETRIDDALASLALAQDNLFNLGDVFQADGLESIGPYISAFVASVSAALQGAGAGFAAAGMQLPLFYAAGIASGAGLAADSASSMSLGALSAAQSGASGAANIGSMISAGVASGIRSGQSGVVSAAVEMVRAAINAANAEAQIHSPSKVTTRMGKFWDEGWAVGIEKNTRIATHAASDMVAQVMRIMDGGVAPDIEDQLRAAVYVEPPAGVAYGAARETAPTVRVAGQAIDCDALAEAMNARQVALYMNDRRMAQVMAAETARAQSVRNRSIALGYGK